VRLARRFEHGQWFVLIEEFDITGLGASPYDALDEAFSLLESHLHAHCEAGTPFEKTLRPIPRSLRLKIRAGGIVSRLLPEARRPGERRTLVSPSMLRHAAC
jgi:hypothetical protein